MSLGLHVKLPWSGTLPQAEASGDPRVHLLESAARPGRTRAERRAVALLTLKGPLPLRLLIDGIAQDLYTDELGRGGWAADIGCIGAIAFRDDARRIVDGATGVLWTIDRSPGIVAR